MKLFFQKQGAQFIGGWFKIAGVMFKRKRLAVLMYIFG